MTRSFYRVCLLSTLALLPSAVSMARDSSVPSSLHIRLQPQSLVRDLCKEALNGSGELEFMASELRLGYRARQLSLSSLLPTLSVGVEKKEYRDTVLESSWLTHLNLGLRQRLWDGGEWLGERRVQGARLERLAAALSEAKRESERQCLLFLAEYLRCRELVVLRRGQRDFMEDEVRRLSLLVERGALTELDYQGTRIALEEAELEYQRALLALDAASSLISRLLRRPAGEDLERIYLETIHLDIDNETDIPVESLSWPPLLDARLALREAELTLDSRPGGLRPQVWAEASLLAQGDRRPLSRLNWSLSLFMILRSPWVNSSLSSTFSTTRQGALGVDSTIALSAGDDPREVLSKERARTALSGARRGLAQAQLEALDALRFAFSRRDLDRRALHTAGERVAHEEEKLGRARLFLDNGRLSPAEWLEAALKADSGRLALCEARHALLLSCMEIERLASCISTLHDKLDQGVHE